MCVGCGGLSGFLWSHPGDGVGLFSYFFRYWCGCRPLSPLPAERGSAGKVVVMDNSSDMARLPYLSNDSTEHLHLLHSSSTPTLRRVTIPLIANSNLHTPRFLVAFLVPTNHSNGCIPHSHLPASRNGAGRVHSRLIEAILPGCCGSHRSRKELHSRRLMSAEPRRRAILTSPLYLLQVLPLPVVLSGI